MSAKPLDKITGSSPPSVHITALKISSDKLLRIVFKHLNVCFSHFHVRNNDLLTNAAQYIVILKQVFVF